MPKLWADSLDEHRSLVRRRLVDAFVSLVAEQPLDEVTVAAVAERADLARSAFYNHVDHLHDLALLHAERGVTDWVASIRAVADTPARERLAALVSASLHAFAQDPIGGVDLSGHLDEQRTSQLRRILDPVRAELVAICRDGVESAEFVAMAPEVLSGFVWAVIGGYRPAVGGGRLDVEETVAVATELLLRAVVVDAAPSSSAADDRLGG